MAVAEVERNIVVEPPPDTRGPSSPLSATALWTGIASIVAVIGGLIFLQINYAVSDRVLTPECVELNLTSDITGALNVCNMVEALRSETQTLLLFGGIALGIAAMVLGWGIAKKMDSFRRREQAVTGAILGAQAIVIALVILAFRNGRPDCSARTSSTSPSSVTTSPGRSSRR